MSTPPIDLRSDTVTRPTEAMRAAIAAAAVRWRCACLPGPATT
jgi:hypothetical protein